jgi:hypothetical protein
MEGPLRLALRVTASIGLILALSIATSVVVSRHAFVHILLDLTESRIFALADDIGDVFAATVRLGLPLDQIGNGSEILKAALPLDPQIVALAVVSAEGDLLYRADEGAGADFDWLGAGGVRGEGDPKKGNRRKVVHAGDMLVVWTAVLDPLGRTTGHIGIAASSTYRNMLVRNSFKEVLSLSGIVLVLATLLTAIGAIVACRGISLILRRIGQMADRPETDAGDPLGGIGAAAMGKLDWINGELTGIEAAIAAPMITRITSPASAAATLPEFAR